MLEGALQGIRVADFSRVLAGPWAAMTLGDLGADVIKVEPPGGDDTRGLGPPFLGPPFRGELSAYFACANRNKRSFVLDLREPRSRTVLDRILQWADVLIENYRTGVADALGLGYARVAEINPRLVYATVSGYGREGSAATRAGYDFVIQAEAGLMSITGPAGGEPCKVGVAVADLFAAQNLTTGILAALLARERTGLGQRVAVSLYDSQLQMLANIGSNYLFSGQATRRFGNTHASIVPYQTFDTSDGAIAVAVASQRLWIRFCAALGLTELETDPRFRDNPGRVRNRDALIPMLQEVFSSRDSADWLARLEAAEVPCAPIRRVDEALDHPLTAERGMRIEIDGVPMIASPIRLGRDPVSYRKAPPQLDADRDSVLADLNADEVRRG